MQKQAKAWTLAALVYSKQITDHEYSTQDDLSDESYDVHLRSLCSTISWFSSPNIARNHCSLKSFLVRA